jgi:monoamine oxidase
MTLVDGGADTPLDVAIVGGGLCGLALANSLNAQGLSQAVYEARDRLGGRILSPRAINNGLALDMGAAWFWPANQPRMVRLLGDLKLASFPQHDTGRISQLVNADGAPRIVDVDDLHNGAWRIEGGAGSVIDALVARLPTTALHRGYVLESLCEQSQHIELRFGSTGGPVTVWAHQVVLALPPRLVDERLAFEPPLNGQLRERLRETPTWMAGQAKLAVAYGGPDGVSEDGMSRAAFWREEGLSGNGLASYPRAALGEVHDACDALGFRAAFNAFFALPADIRAQFRQGLPLLAVSQLAQWFGRRAQAGEVHLHDWAEEPWTCATLDRMPLEEHPDYGDPVLSVPAWQGRLHFGGSETATHGGGYMEGALEAAARLRREILVSRVTLGEGAGP